MTYPASHSQPGVYNPGPSACKAFASPLHHTAPSANRKGCTLTWGRDHLRVTATGGPALHCPVRRGFLSLSTINMIIICWLSCPVHCRMFGSISGLYSLDTSTTTTSSHNNQKCLQTLPDVPCEMGGKMTRLRNTVLNQIGVGIICRPNPIFLQMGFLCGFVIVSL